MIRRSLSSLGRHFCRLPDLPAPQPALDYSISTQMDAIGKRCTDCGACMRHCAFLQHHGSPLAIVRRLTPDETDQLQMAFGCSLCGLCTAVCPQKLDPCSLFLDMRRQRVGLGNFDWKPYRSLLTYEALGRSKLFSWFGLPPGCKTVFFPGCALPGTRPAISLRMFQHLQKMIPTLGIVFKCCTKPSHDLGRHDCFLANFREIKTRLQAHGITTVLTACPNCTKIFRQYAPEITTQSVFTLLADHSLPNATQGQGQKITIHDPCPLRDDQTSQEAVRILLQGLGYISIPMPHQQKQTLCCGEGGAVGFVHPGFTEAWTLKRVAEAAGRPLVTSCAGCSSMLARSTEAIHLADLLFPSTRKGQKIPAVSRPPMTYLNRLWLQFRLKRLLNT
ncbi:MAG: (Fe-S)-binding protein [Desulfobulbus sp.]|nr:(Fe-S)-binding protein [Desulfobulbus sp.]